MILGPLFLTTASRHVVAILAVPMPTDQEFSTRADRFMEDLLEALDALDPDDLDCQLAMGVLTMEFADGTKCILNRQTAAQQIWLAYGATAWHFARDESTDQWLDTKGRGDLRTVLAQTISDKLDQQVNL